jgi:hypothetical protein
MNPNPTTWNIETGRWETTARGRAVLWTPTGFVDSRSVV